MVKVVIDNEIDDDWIKSLPGYKDEIAIHRAIAKKLDDARDSTPIELKGGPGSGNFGHAGRPGKVGGSTTGNRVWAGQTLERAGERLSKLKTGEIGEKLAMKVLEDKFGASFSTLNAGLNNAPIDVAGDHTAVEVKTGLASVGKSAQHWRATIGQPGIAERELLKAMDAQEKRTYNEFKKQQIIQRKESMLDKMRQAAGAEVKPYTVGIILDPDGSKGDVFLIPGFHLYLSWNQYATDDYYVGTYDV
jgi:hypothetical protein